MPQESNDFLRKMAQKSTGGKRRILPLTVLRNSIEFPSLFGNLYLKLLLWHEFA